ncbi:MAG: hypothetical protein IPJ41_01755 [Phycisphaerales bacterium]|nr:hypothetical protein [Phycisphaerales bacterium]
MKGRDYYVDVKVVMSMLDLSDNGWVDEPDAALWINDPEDLNSDSSADSRDLQLIVDNLGQPAD